MNIMRARGGGKRISRAVQGILRIFDPIGIAANDCAHHAGVLKIFLRGIVSQHDIVLPARGIRNQPADNGCPQICEGSLRIFIPNPIQIGPSAIREPSKVLLHWDTSCDR